MTYPTCPKRGYVVSAGHLGWQETYEGLKEIYRVGEEIYRAPVANVIDTQTGCRIGRWICFAENWERTPPETLLGDGFEAA